MSATNLLGSSVTAVASLSASPSREGIMNPGLGSQDFWRSTIFVTGRALSSSALIGLREPTNSCANAENFALSVGSPNSSTSFLHLSIQGSERCPLSQKRRRIRQLRTYL